MLTDILKTAADAVNKSRLRGNNTVVDALVLLFNYVFDNEVWPDRASSSHNKHNSCLELSNYRPIRRRNSEPAEIVSAGLQSAHDPW